MVLSMYLALLDLHGLQHHPMAQQYVGPKPEAERERRWLVG